MALVFSFHPHHAFAAATHAKATARNPACFCRSTQQSFLRLATTPVLLRAYDATGLTNREVLNIYSSLVAARSTGFLEEPAGLQAIWHDLARLDSASPKVWMDAYLAAFAICHKIELATFDRDFQNFERHGLKLKLVAS